MEGGGGEAVTGECGRNEREKEKETYWAQAREKSNVGLRPRVNEFMSIPPHR